MFVTRVNQICAVLSSHWESDARKGNNNDAKAMACALKAEQQVHSTGRPIIDLRVEWMETFGLRRYASIERAAQILERATPERIADVFAGRVSINEALSAPKYTVKIPKPNLIEGDSGMSDKLVIRKKREKVIPHYTPQQLAHSGARKLLNFEYKVGFLKTTGMAIPVENRIFRYVCKTVFDSISGESLRGGDILRLDEIVYEKTIYSTQKTRTDGGFDKCKREAKSKLPSVHRAFNFWLNETSGNVNPSGGTALLPKLKDGEVIGLIIPTAQSDVDSYFMGQRRRETVAAEGITIYEKRIKAIIDGGSLLQLPSASNPFPSSDEDDTSGVNSEAKGTDETKGDEGETDEKAKGAGAE